MLIGDLSKFLERLHRLPELLGKLFMLLILPAVSQRGKARLEGAHPVLQIDIEALQLLCEATHFIRIHDCLGHSDSGVGVSLPAKGAPFRGKTQTQDSRAVEPAGWLSYRLRLEVNLAHSDHD